MIKNVEFITPGKCHKITNYKMRRRSLSRVKVVCLAVWLVACMASWLIAWLVGGLVVGLVI